MSDIDIQGGKELEQALLSFTIKMEKKMLRGGLRAGAKVIADEAKARVPVKLGKLRDSIRVGTAVKDGQVMATIKAGRNKKKDDPYYANMVEYGTAPHVIVAGGGTKAGKVLAAGARILGEKVDHPGASAKPFMRPALDMKAQPALDRTAEYLRDRIEKENLKK